MEAAFASTLLDEHTRQCLAIHPAWSIRAVDVITVVEATIARYGVPEHLRSDNGPEFIASCMQDWLKTQLHSSSYRRKNTATVMRSRESSATENFSTKIAHGFYDAEVNNGGHHQYFWNSRGYFVDLVEKGLDYYRAKEQLAIFREAMSRDDPSPEKESTEPASSPPVEFSWEAIERVARRLGKELLMA